LFVPLFSPQTNNLPRALIGNSVLNTICPDAAAVNTCPFQIGISILAILSVMVYFIMRSRIIAETLVGLGYTGIYRLIGGLTGWEAAGLEVIHQ